MFGRPAMGFANLRAGTRVLMLVLVQALPIARSEAELLRATISSRVVARPNCVLVSTAPAFKRHRRMPRDATAALPRGVKSGPRRTDRRKQGPKSLLLCSRSWWWGRRAAARARRRLPRMLNTGGP